ncbi:unnamed protein product [Adineta steineri]|uniref:Uncharacterized protein n=1 Tax=Adineta steineri TaxID=433720 RepID=A0A814GJA5_9BILA|nr:unnamed protein product [Adineta steineri]
MTSQPLISLCDRLKQRYENNQQDWKSLFQDQIQDKNSRDIEFIRYIVNSIIEQAKHNIVISELPDVIRTLHCEAETIIRKNRMITLEEAMAQIQIAGAKKYPYLKKIKPISTEDFVKEVMYEVFNRIGTVITLDMFVTCSAKQLLHAMPAIDVNEAASLIVEDILRHQDNNVSSPTSKEWMNSKRESLKLMQNSNQSYDRASSNERKHSSICSPLISRWKRDEKQEESIMKDWKSQTEDFKQTTHESSGKETSSGEHAQYLQKLRF